MKQRTKTQTRTSQFEHFEPGNEVKAFIYQQVQDLEQFVKDLGSLAVLIEKEEMTRAGKNPLERYAVTFVVAPESVNLKIRSESEDIFEACRLAKLETQKKLNSFINANWDPNSNGVTQGSGWVH